MKNTTHYPAVMSRQTAGVSILGVIMYTHKTMKFQKLRNPIKITCRALVRSSSPWVTFFRNSLTKVRPLFSHIIASVAEFWTEVVLVDFSCRIIAWRLGNFSRSVSYLVRIFDILPLKLMNKVCSKEVLYLMSILTGWKALEPSLSRMGRKSPEASRNGSVGIRLLLLLSCVTCTLSNEYFIWLKKVVGGGVATIVSALGFSGDGSWLDSISISLFASAKSSTSSVGAKAKINLRIILGSLKSYLRRQFVRFR